MLKSQDFWEKLNKPIYALAPLAGITDSAFRIICKEFGADIVYSEMASVNALNYAPEQTLEMLKFSKNERPYVVQLFGNNPEYFALSVKIIEKEIKPDGIDINFGCPVPKVLKQGAGAALMQNLDLSREVIKSVINNTSLPVSIKLRSKVNSISVLKFLDFMSGLDIRAVMIHGRALSQGFSGQVDFNIIKKSRKYFNGIILANGGVMSAEDAKNLLCRTGADGLGIARGALGRPWIFKDIKENMNYIKNTKEIFKIALKHSKLAKKKKGEQGIIEMRKHLCWYAQGIAGAKRIREKFVQVENIKDIKNAIKEYY